MSREGDCPNHGTLCHGAYCADREAADRAEAAELTRIDELEHELHAVRSERDLLETQKSALASRALGAEEELERANQKIIGAERLLLRASRCIELDDWRDDYDAWMSGCELAPDGSAKYSTLCYEGDCAKMTGRARPCPIHDREAK